MLGVKSCAVSTLCASIILFSMHAADQSAPNEFGKRLIPSCSSSSMEECSDQDFLMNLFDAQLPSEDLSARAGGPFAAQRQLLFLPDADMATITESPDERAAKRQRHINQADESISLFGARTLLERIELLESTIGFLAGVVGESNDKIECLKTKNELLSAAITKTTVDTFRAILPNVSIEVVELLALNNLKQLTTLDIPFDDSSMQAIRLFTANRFYDVSRCSHGCLVQQKRMRKRAVEWFAKAEGKPIHDNIRPLYEKLKKHLCGERDSSLLLGQSSLL